MSTAERIFWIVMLVLGAAGFAYGQYLNRQCDKSRQRLVEAIRREYGGPSDG